MTVREKNLLLFVLAGFAAFGAWLISFNPEHMNFMCQEDGFVEYSQAFLYLFAGAGFAYVAAHKPFRNVWYWGYAALFLVVAGEETAWAQRIFSVATPTAIAIINVQKDLTLHNIAGIHEHHHLYGLLVCTVICLVIPLTDRFVAPLRRLYARLRMPIYPLWTWTVPCIGFAFMIVPRLFHTIDFKYDEMAELYLGFAFFGFATDVYVRARGTIEGTATADVPRAREPVRLAA